MEQDDVTKVVFRLMLGVVLVAFSLAWVFHAYMSVRFEQLGRLIRSSDAYYYGELRKQLNDQTSHFDTPGDGSGVQRRFKGNRRPWPWTTYSSGNRSPG